MSVKIYQAWRWKKELGVFPVIGKIQVAARKEIEKQLRKLVRYTNIGNNRRARWEMASMLSWTTRISTTSQYINPYGINIVFLLRETPEHYLCMPLHPRDDFNFIKDIEGVEEFGYWDNTDRPVGISQEDWEARRQFWIDHWKPERPCIQFSALNIQNPEMEITEMLVPEGFREEELPEDYWEVDQ